MVKRALQIIGIGIIVGVLVFMVLILLDRGAEAPTEQNNDTNQQTTNNEPESTSIKPNPNNQEFHLTASNLSCSSSTLNGASSRSCSGNISAVPLAQSDVQPGVYKINEQTKLLHDGQEQDLSSLQQLAQNNTVVRLKLAESSTDTLAEIYY
jgi:hypothetical protein